MPTEPETPTLAQAVARAAEACDPEGGDDAISDLRLRLEDRDEPITALHDVQSELDEAAGRIDPESEDPGLAMTVAVAVHLAHRCTELDLDADELLVQAVRSQFGGNPPEHVGAWVAERGGEP
jgi:hypothetical protein